MQTAPTPKPDPKMQKATEYVEEFGEMARREDEDESLSEKELLELHKKWQKNVQEFVSPQEGEKQDDPSVLAREDALMEAAKQFGDTHKEITESAVYACIWGIDGDPVLRSAEFLNHFDKIEKISHLILRRALIQAVEEHPGEFMKVYDKISDRSYAGDLLEKATQNALEQSPYVILEQYEWLAAHLRNNGCDETKLDAILKESVLGSSSHTVLRQRKLLDGKPYGEEEIKKAAYDAICINPTGTLKHHEFLMELPETKGWILDVIRQDLKQGVKILCDFPDAPFAKEGSMLIANGVPVLTIKYFQFWYGKEFEEELAEVVAYRAPYAFEKHLREKMGKRPYGEKLLKSVSEMIRHADALRAADEKGIAENQKAVEKTIEKINPDFLSAVDLFNQETGLSLKAMGIKKEPYEFVLIDTFEGKNKLPVRIAITYPELKEGKQELIQLLRDKCTQQKKTLGQQYELWSKQYEYTLPDNGKTAAMFIAAPGHLEGIETDFERMIEIYKQRYGVSVDHIMVDNAQKWKEASKDAKELPDAVELTTGAALEAKLKTALVDALRGNKQSFVLHYTMHGGEDGSITVTKSESLDTQKIAEIIATPMTIDGKEKIPCVEMDIVILAESCHSDSQLITIIEYLKKKNVPVKNLHIATSSAKETSSHAGTTIDNASLVSKEMAGDKSGTFAYYFSYYFELIDHLKQKKAKETDKSLAEIQLEKPLGTYSHALQFADRMAREDSYDESNIKALREQDLQGYHYSTKEDIDEYFSWLQETPSKEEKEHIV